MEGYLMTKLISLALITMLSTGCAATKVSTGNFRPNNQLDGLDEISQSMREISEHAAAALNQLSDANIINAKANGVNKHYDVRQGKILLPNSLSEEFKAQVSLDYNGEIEGLIAKVALIVDYQLEVVGKNNAHQVISVHAEKQTLEAVIRQAYAQASINTGIRIYQKSRTIILDYGNGSHG